MTQISPSPEAETLVSALARARSSSFGVAFVDREERLTRFDYETLWQRALVCAGGLVDLGVSPGDRVALVMPTTPTFYDAFFGALVAGAVPVPLYPPVRLGRLNEYHAATARMLHAAGVRVLVTEAGLRRLLGRTIDAARPALGCRTVAELKGAPYTPRSDDPDALAVIQFSSGTTVDPKPVALTHRQILANLTAATEAIVSAYPEGNGLVHSAVSWLPLYHDMGLGFMLGAAVRPADLTLIPPELFVARPGVWLRVLARQRASTSAAPNFAYSLCAERVEDNELEGVDLSHWCVALNGAEPVTVAALERFIARFERFGFRAETLTPVYGLAEATLAVSFSNPARCFVATSFDEQRLAREGRAESVRLGGRRLVSVGKPLPGYRVQVVDERRRPLADGLVGRLLVQGPSVMQGYFGRPEATAAAVADGWLDTGDTGFIHDGELYIYGRAKDLLIVRGRKLAPQAVEQALEGTPGMRAGCSVAVTTVLGDEGEALVVFLERSRDSQVANDDALAAEARARVAQETGLGVSRVVVLAPGTLPRTSSGKLRRGETLRRYLAGELQPPAPVTLLRIGREILRSSWLWRRRGIR